LLHCDKRLVDGRIGLREGLGYTSYPYAAGVASPFAPPESGWGAAGAVSPHQRKRTRGAGERLPARRGSIRRKTRARPTPVGSGGRPTFAQPEGALLPGTGGGAEPQLRVCYRPVCAELATTYPTAEAMLRAAHGEAIVAALVHTLVWVTRGAGSVLRGSPSPLLAVVGQYLVDTTPDAIGYQMASRLKEHGQRVAPASSAPAAGGGSTCSPYAAEPATDASPYYDGCYSYSAGSTPAAKHAAYIGGNSSAEAGPSRAPRSMWGSTPRGRGPAHEYSVDPPVRDHYGGSARDDVPPSGHRCLWPVPVQGAPGLSGPLHAPTWVGRSPRVARGRSVACFCMEGLGIGGFARCFPRSGAVSFLLLGRAWEPCTQG